MKVKRKYWTTDYLFFYLCFNYFFYEDQTIESIEKLEKILFLMQYDSLKEYNVPFLVYKTYCDTKGHIYLPFLSDLLRIYFLRDCNPAYCELEDQAAQYQYEKKMDIYRLYSYEQLNDKVTQIIENESLKRRYFRKRKCLLEKYWRIRTRIYIRQREKRNGVHAKEGFLLRHDTFFIFLATFILFCIILLTDQEVAPTNDLYPTLLAMIALLGFHFNLQIRSTEFERKLMYMRRTKRK